MSDFLIDLASARLGGSITEASDEHFGGAARLLADDPPGHEGGRFDGWQTHRRRVPGHEWSIIRLGLPGILRRVSIDMSHTDGSHPVAIALEAIDLPGEPHLIDLVRRPERWQTILPRTSVEPDADVVADIEGDRAASHLRLVLYPDGAVARLRALGEPLPPTEAIRAKEADLAAVVAGGRAVDCSDARFGSPNAMLLDERHRSEGGWLTRRRRDGRHDWAIVRLAGPTDLRRLVVDTHGFEGDAPQACSVEGTISPSGASLGAVEWDPVLPRVAIKGDQRNEFSELASRGPFTHLRLSIYPDGGIARFCAFGAARGAWNA